MILYIYKIIIGLVPNPGFEEFPYNDRTGLKVRAKQNRKAAPWVQNLRNSSFFNVGPTVFNSLPLHLRNFTIPDTPTKEHVEEYKKTLDEFLWQIPDQPDVSGRQRSAETNSIVHQMQYCT